jgi:signal transduction histidine kinase
MNAQAALALLDPRPSDFGVRPPDLEQVRQALERIDMAGRQARDVVGRIRALVKKAPARKDRLEINEAIRQVIALTGGEAMKNGVAVRTQLAEGLPPVRSDQVQLQQVILNLIMNAVEAMSGTSEGPRELLVSTGGNGSGGVLVTVRDSGPGIAPAHLDHLFDAFYTTKPGGLGMGLSICRSIIEAHGGRLWAEASHAHGAVFQFILPLEDEEIAAELAG